MNDTSTTPLGLLMLAACEVCIHWDWDLMLAAECMWSVCVFTETEDWVWLMWWSCWMNTARPVRQALLCCCGMKDRDVCVGESFVCEIQHLMPVRPQLHITTHSSALIEFCLICILTHAFKMPFAFMGSIWLNLLRWLLLNGFLI